MLRLSYGLSFSLEPNMPRTDASTSLRNLAGGFFSPGPPVTFRAAHGALDVLGAMNADSGGTLAQIALPAQSSVALQFLPQPTLRILRRQIMPPLGEPELSLPPDTNPRALPIAAAWAAPVLALWQHLAPQSPGAAILLHTDVPVGAGQASTTALLAALASALMGADAPPAPLAIAQAVAAAARGREPPSGRIMSALTCLHPRDPRRPVLLRYSAQPYRLVGPVPLPPDVRILALDTGVRHRLARGPVLDELRLAAAMGYRIIETIYRDLGRNYTPLSGYLANTSPLLYRQYFRTLLPRRLRGSDFLRAFGPLPEAASDGTPPLDPGQMYRVRTAVDHLIAENEHAEQFLQTMEELADAPQVMDQKSRVEHGLLLARAGRLLLASHHSYRLRLELSCREADWLVDRLMEAGPDRGVFGARITRAGGGGTVVALLDRSSTATDTLLETLRAYHQLTGLTLGIAEA